MGEAKRKSECGYDMVMFTIGARDDLTPSTCEKDSRGMENDNRRESESEVCAASRWI